jgi:hypothetical protein
MKRHVDQLLFAQFLKDFHFLFDRIRKSNGELDLRLRGNKFNIYYKGNSLALITIKSGSYDVSIHSSFSINVFDKDARIPTPKVSGTYNHYILVHQQLHQFFQVKYLDKIASLIKSVNYGEEITFEQMLITDNLYNPDILIIDRQITETALSRRRLDLLALQHVEGNKFCFLVLEVKLGNNPELPVDAGYQLTHYIDHIKSHFLDWKTDFEKVYIQLQQTCIYPNFIQNSIEIIEPVEGRVVVGHYSGIAGVAITNLKSKFPGINVEHFTNKLR